MQLATKPLNQLYELPQGAQGTRATLRLMSRLVRSGRINPEIISKAQEIVAYLIGKNYYAEAEAIFNWIKNTVRYTQDPNGTEMLLSPEVILHSLQGDCDDMSILFASLVQSIGKPTRFIAVGFSRPGEFEHVFTQVLIGRDWVSADPTMPVEFGWSPLQDQRAVAYMVENT